MWSNPIDSPENSGYYMLNLSWDWGIRVDLSPLTSLYLCLGDVSHHQPYLSQFQVTGFRRRSCNPAMPDNNKAPILPCSSNSALELPPELPVQLHPEFLFVCLFGILQGTTLYPRTVGALHISPQQPQYTFPRMGCDLNKNLHHWGKGQKVSTGRCSLAFACYLRNAVFYQDEQHHLCRTKEVSPLVLSAGP